MDQPGYAPGGRIPDGERAGRPLRDAASQLLVYALPDEPETAVPGLQLRVPARAVEPGVGPPPRERDPGGVSRVAPSGAAAHGDGRRPQGRRARSRWTGARLPGGRRRGPGEKDRLPARQAQQNRRGQIERGGRGEAARGARECRDSLRKAGPARPPQVQGHARPLPVVGGAVQAGSARPELLAAPPCRRGGRQGRDRGRGGVSQGPPHGHGPAA
mmetsp:Transcript_34644/g.82085  ORF Transcript_34644/g.82085 Transcript_34644/m.82085 type:complete len:215 (+) Transcript_34644:699-1343(+)